MQWQQSYSRAAAWLLAAPGTLLVVWAVAPPPAQSRKCGSQVRLRPSRQGRKCSMHLYAQTGSPLCLPTCGRAMGCHRCVVSSCHPSAALQAAGCGLDVSISPKGTRSAQALISSPHFNMLVCCTLLGSLSSLRIQPPRSPSPGGMTIWPPAYRALPGWMAISTSEPVGSEE